MSACRCSYHVPCPGRTSPPSAHVGYFSLDCIQRCLALVVLPGHPALLRSVQVRCASCYPQGHHRFSQMYHACTYALQEHAMGKHPRSACRCSYNVPCPGRTSPHLGRRILQGMPLACAVGPVAHLGFVACDPADQAIASHGSLPSVVSMWASPDLKHGGYVGAVYTASGVCLCASCMALCDPALRDQSAAYIGALVMYVCLMADL